ncbi:MAG: hypothetical protein AAGA48_18285 [Myxococcota bacterium]
MKRFGAWTLAILLAFGLGVSGLPGHAMAWATTRLLDDGTIALEGPMERGVRQALILEEVPDVPTPPNAKAARAQ